MIFKKRPMLFLWIALLLLLGVAATYGVSQTLISHAEQEVLDSLQQAVAQTAINIEDRMRSITALSQMISSDTRLQSSIWRGADDETMENQLQDIKQLRELITVAMGRGDIALVRLYISGTKMLSRERVNFYPLTELETLPEYAAGAWGGYWYQNHIISTLGFSGPVLSYCRAVRGSRLFDEVCAFLIIDVSAQRLQEVICSLQLPGTDGTGRVFLMDSLGRMMLDDGQEGTDALALCVANAAGNAGFLTENGREMTYIKKPLQESGWILAMIMPRDNLLAGSKLLRTSLFFVILVLALVSALSAAALAFVAYTHGVRQQISRINRSLAESGQPVCSTRHTERDLFQLNHSIEELLRTAAHATEEAYGARLREREAVLRALQAQINPHFLYNTLDTINWMALDANAPDVSHMIETLGCYYRMILSKGRDILPLSEEVALVRVYLELQSERFDHEFSVIWKTETEAETCLLPKLTLQPLVENALLHGLRKRQPMAGARLEIRATVHKAWLHVAVLDNGPGLQKTDHAGYGLTNVRQRLELFTAGRYELTLKNRPEGGGAAEMRLPARYDAPES